LPFRALECRVKLQVRFAGKHPFAHLEKAFHLRDVYRRISRRLGNKRQE
jgi:hypothetical protein